MRRLVIAALWVEACVLGVLCPVVLIIPEIPLGRVVETDLRWMLAAGWCVIALLSLQAARATDPGVLRGIAAALVLANLAHGGAAFVMPDMPHRAVHAIAALLFASVALVALRWPSEIARS